MFVLQSLCRFHNTAESVGFPLTSSPPPPCILLSTSFPRGPLGTLLPVPGALYTLGLGQGSPRASPWPMAHVEGDFCREQSREVGVGEHTQTRARAHACARLPVLFLFSGVPMDRRLDKPHSHIQGNIAS